MKVKPGRNKPTTIMGRDYSGHALDRMQERGLVPSVVENTIAHGTPSAGSKPGTTAHYSEQKYDHHYEHGNRPGNYHLPGPRSRPLAWTKIPGIAF